MKSSAVPWSRCMLRMICTIWACVLTSSAVVGSSATIRAGSLAKAMAMSTRWHMPPESWNE